MLATAVIPGIGTGVTLALSGLETAGFLEATALFAQSVAEVHGIAVDNPDRARALVMTLMLGREGGRLLRRGKAVHHCKVADTTPALLAQAMMGESASADAAPQEPAGTAPTAADAAIALQVVGLTAPGDRVRTVALVLPL